MRNVLVKTALWVVVGLSAFAWWLLSLIYAVDLSEPTGFFGLAPKVVTFDLLVVGVFVRWGWKLKIFKGWLVPFPNLSGTWTGTINSQWRDPATDQRCEPIPTMLTVSQSFFHISCVLQTNEMKSHSYAEHFLLDSERQLKSLAYSYSSDPKLSVRDQNNLHRGSALVQIIETPKLKLYGEYWTNRQSNGEIELEHYSDELLEEIPIELKQQPAKG